MTGPPTTPDVTNDDVDTSARLNALTIAVSVLFSTLMGSLSDTYADAVMQGMKDTAMDIEGPVGAATAGQLEAMFRNARDARKTMP